ncbi:uroporphyrinogen III methyltransferase / synthase [Singulisphaera sp. GP187]|uniref:uroporphyrinogen-III C-methyltransferase n=1 Tax=Singulisphaera sp. GP187 TaxID=1882752 RepID=UPI0009271E76|nr:uroporphyrinogen-III C-methyltransferase [Singulisphaera sp. GP187]SIO01037.1 uroporphyrinogen III methyltransferase / synthase [Singulisphaera sp. GP187]
MAVNRGIVYLVGAGPGDPGLLTRRGEALLKLADVVVYDHLASSRLLDLAPKTARLICAGKSIGHNTLSQGAINELLAEHAKAGRTVVRLKGGDPYVFGRGAEEAEFLRESGVAFQVVPGVTAAVGVTAYAGVPVTHRDAASAVAFVTGHNDPDALSGHGRLDWAALALFPGTLVIYMGVTRLESLCKTLVRLGKPPTTPAALIEAGTLPRQRTVSGTLANLHERVTEAGLGPPALLVVGEVVARRPNLRWFENQPLFGQRIVVTRPEGETESSAAVLESFGAEVLIAPTVEIRPLESYDELDQTIGRLAEFRWLVFTSVNGVDGFLERLDVLGRDVRALGHLKLAAIGPATAGALGRYHLKADLVPRSFRSEDLAEALAPAVAGGRVLLARADRGRTVLKDELEKIAEVEQVAVYRNTDADALPAAVVARIEQGSIDWITLTSSAITERLYSLLSESARERVGREIRLASLSPVTSEAARRLGWNVAAEANVFTWAGLVDAIVEVVATERANAAARL